MPLPPTVAICHVQETRANYVEGPTDSICIIILELSQLLPLLLVAEEAALLLLDPPLPLSPVASLVHGTTLDAICKLFSNPFMNPKDLRPLSNRDNVHGRIFSDEIPDNANMTVETCVELCNSSNFTVAGIEFAVQCCQCFSQHESRSLILYLLQSVGTR